MQDKNDLDKKRAGVGQEGNPQVNFGKIGGVGFD